MFYLMYLNGQSPLAMVEAMFAGVKSKFAAARDAVVNLPGSVDTAFDSEVRTYYKWQDAGGAWIYGENPPADSLSLTSIKLRLTDNVLPAYTAPKPEVAEQKQTVQPKAETPELPSPYSPGQIKKLFEDTQKLQETLHQRQLDQDAILGIKHD
jgi:hypothetical protein